MPTKPNKQLYATLKVKEFTKYIHYLHIFVFNHTTCTQGMLIVTITTLLYMIHTLCCIAASPILHEYIVERLISPIGQLMDPHGGDPLWTHCTFRVPSIDHTVIPRADKTGGKEPKCSGDQIYRV